MFQLKSKARDLPHKGPCGSRTCTVLRRPQTLTPQPIRLQLGASLATRSNVGRFSTPVPVRRKPRGLSMRRISRTSSFACPVNVASRKSHILPTVIPPVPRITTRCLGGSPGVNDLLARPLLPDDSRVATLLKGTLGDCASQPPQPTFVKLLVTVSFLQPAGGHPAD